MALNNLSTKKKNAEGVWMEVLDQNGDPCVDGKGKVVRFKVVGQNSKQFKAQQKITLEKAKKQKNGLSAAETLERTYKTYANTILDWENVEWEDEETSKIKKLEPTMENKLMLFDESEIILNQVIAFVNESEHFLAV